jgi:mannose-1-phosphate guanylyltransferase
MKAMVLAAGLGTRLRPLTDDRPKALVEVAGRTMLEITLERLRNFGVNEVIVNVHHFADMVIDYLQANRNFGMRIEISREDVLLDTGGGLKKAAWFFLEDAGDQPFLLHNVDVISTIDLARLLRFHVEQDALATMAVQARATSRPLLFDDRGQFRGRAGHHELDKEPGLQSRAFSGIHAISPRIFDKLTEGGVFSIIDSYVCLSAEGEKILAFRADEYYWRDLGRPENVAQAGRDLQSRKLDSTKTLSS